VFFTHASKRIDEGPSRTNGGKLIRITYENEPPERIHVNGAKQSREKLHRWHGAFVHDNVLYDASALFGWFEPYWPLKVTIILGKKRGKDAFD
jgi:hypothetical protein